MKYTKSIILGIIYGSINGVLIILSSLGGVPDTRIQWYSIYTYLFFPYYLTSNILFSAPIQNLLDFSTTIFGYSGMSGLLLNLILAFVMVGIPISIGIMTALIIGHAMKIISK